MIKETEKLLRECVNPGYNKILENDLTSYKAIKKLLDEKY